MKNRESIHHNCQVDICELPSGEQYLDLTFKTPEGDYTVPISTNLAEMIGGAGAGVRQRNERRKAAH